METVILSGWEFNNLLPITECKTKLTYEVIYLYLYLMHKS